MAAELQSPEEQEERPDEAEVLQNKIADQLSELSSIDTLPIGYKARTSSFSQGEVQFSSSVWLLRLLQIQPWLWLDEEVPVGLADSAPLEVAKKLFAQIADATVNSLEVRDGVVSLTIAGAEALSDRLDIAVRLQQAFVENLETLNRKDASKLWVEAWEEEANSRGAFNDQIRAKSDTWCLNEFSYYAKQGGLNLNPSYQRGDVWPTSDSQKLIESILRGIPLPSIILLRPADKRSKKRFEVVDGKQRLTAILRFVGEHPEAIKLVKQMDQRYPKANLMKLFREDYRKFRRAWKRVIGESLSDKVESAYYFPFALKSTSRALTGELKSLAGKYYCEISDEELQVGDEQETVEVLFERTSQYRVPIIEYTEATPRQIQEVFNLYNKQGKHLNAEEIRNALYHEVDLVRLLLVAAGDNKNYSELAGYLPSDSHPQLDEISLCLTEYRFGTARYKRTKVLSWLVALLFLPSTGSDGALTVRSTAKQIDELLSSIQQVDDHPFAGAETLRQLISDLHRCLVAHSSADCWSSNFKDSDTGAKWLELHLVASLVGVFLLGFWKEDVDTVLAESRQSLLTFTKNVRRPENAQNNTQWGFVGEVALGMLGVVGADLPVIERNLLQRYGASCIPTLIAARVHHKKG